MFTVIADFICSGILFQIGALSDCRVRLGKYDLFLVGLRDSELRWILYNGNCSNVHLVNEQVEIDCFYNICFILNTFLFILFIFLSLKGYLPAIMFINSISYRFSFVLVCGFYKREIKCIHGNANSWTIKVKMKTTPATPILYLHLQHEYKYRQVYIILKHSLFV